MGSKGNRLCWLSYQNDQFTGNDILYVFLFIYDMKSTRIFFIPYRVIWIYICLYIYIYLSGCQSTRQCLKVMSLDNQMAWYPKMVSSFVTSFVLKGVSRVRTLFWSQNISFSCENFIYFFMLLQEVILHRQC